MRGLSEPIVVVPITQHFAMSQISLGSRRQKLGKQRGASFGAKHGSDSQVGGNSWLYNFLGYLLLLSHIALWGVESIYPELRVVEWIDDHTLLTGYWGIVLIPSFFVVPSLVPFVGFLAIFFWSIDI